MIAVADMDRGTLSLEVEEVDLAPVLRQIAADVGRQYDAVPLELEVPERLVGAADPVRFTEIVRQLFDNACRFSPAGEPVTLKGRAMDEGILVSVTDRGEDLAREVASKAFDEPFTAGEEILRKERAGAGGRAPSSPAARDRARPDHVGRPVAGGRDPGLVRDPGPSGRPGVSGDEAAAASDIRSVSATGFLPEIPGSTTGTAQVARAPISVLC